MPLLARKVYEFSQSTKSFLRATTKDHSVLLIVTIIFVIDKVR